MSLKWHFFWTQLSLRLYTGHATCARALELELMRAVASAERFSREHTKPSSATVRSVSPYAPVSPSWDWAYGPVIRRPPSVPVEYPD